MVRFTLLFLVAFPIGCASSDRIAPVVIPTDGANTDYVEFLPQLRSLAWRTTEAFYRDRWDELDEAAQTLDRAIKVLPQSKNIPQRLQADLPARCTVISEECAKLRQASRERSAAAASDHLQKIHVAIRELRSEP
ncbi:MAG: hypothetical protein ACJ8C4_02710 [Gemmataceae bacterium]